MPMHIHDAAAYNDVRKIEACLLNKEPINCPSSGRVSMLFGGSQIRYMLKLLGMRTQNDRDLMLSTFNTSLWSPLHFAAATGAQEAVNYLISRGASVTTTDCVKRTFADIAREAHGGNSTFYLACQKIYNEAVESKHQLELNNQRRNHNQAQALILNRLQNERQAREGIQVQANVAQVNIAVLNERLHEETLQNQQLNRQARAVRNELNKYHSLGHGLFHRSEDGDNRAANVIGQHNNDLIVKVRR